MAQDWTDDVFDANHEGQMDLANIEKNFAALKSTFLGPTAPANSVAGMGWVDTTTHIYKIRNEANSNWVSIFDLANGVPCGITFPPPFPTGTLMLFAQTAAPTGWTKSTTHNDKTLRVVSGTAGSGGAVAFSTAFGRTATDGHVLTVEQMPSHTHNYNSPSVVNDNPALAGSPDRNAISAATSAAGSNNAHAHNIDLRVNYVDVIIASKAA